MARLLCRFHIVVSPFTALLISLTAPQILAQETSQARHSDPTDAVREAGALQTLRQCYNALGGDHQWLAHTSANIGGTITIAKIDHQIAWADDWSGGSLKSRREFGTNSEKEISTADKEHGIRFSAHGQATESKRGKLTDLAPLHLPAVLLEEVLVNAATSVRLVTNSSAAFRADQEVEVENGSDPFSKQEWWINPTSHLPDQVITYTAGSRHLNRPEPLTTRYVGFASTQGALIPTALETDLGAIHMHVTLTSAVFDVPVATTP